MAKVKKAGRKSSYDGNIHPTWAWSLATIDGMTDDKIAKKMGISRSTLNKWKNDFPEFSDALKSAKAPCDGKVERSLFQRAVGFPYTERRIISSINPQTGQPKIEKIETLEKFSPPDVTAMIYWLKNRKRKEWRDKWEVEFENDKEIVFNIMNATEKDLEES